jgi:hypothetical protein
VLETHGQRLYWLCCVLAVIFIGIGVWFYTVGGIGQVDGVMMAIAYAVIACGFLDDRSRFPICLLVRKRPSLRNNNKAIASTCPLWVKSGHLRQELHRVHVSEHVSRRETRRSCVYRKPYPR